jgi:hypothetical protein
MAPILVARNNAACVAVDQVNKKKNARGAIMRHGRR